MRVKILAHMNPYLKNRSRKGKLNWSTVNEYGDLPLSLPFWPVNKKVIHDI